MDVSNSIHTSGLGANLHSHYENPHMNFEAFQVVVSLLIALLFNAHTNSMRSPGSQRLQRMREAI